MSLNRYIKYYSKHLYRYLTRVFSFKLAIDERGINDAFVFSLVEYCYKKGFANVLIYKSRAPKKESDYGHDFDLFVERSDGKFNYFALQAKAMNFNGKYSGIKSSEKQWEDLKKHEIKFQSKAFYLFYNGQYLTKQFLPLPVRSDCIGIPAIEEYGLGIVENDVVSTLMHSKRSAKFLDFFPQDMDSIRKLFSCEGSGFSGIHGFEMHAIDIKPPYELVKHATADQNEEEENTDLANRDGNASYRIIVKKYP